MQKRELGRSGLQVLAIGLGCMGISFGYADKLSREDGVKLIRAAAGDRYAPAQMAMVGREAPEKADA